MDYASVLERLNGWQADELLFRDSFLVERGELSRRELLERYRSDPQNLDIALHPDRISTHRREDEFIAEGRNVGIVKHPRFLPLFFHSHAFFEMIYILSGRCVQHFLGGTLNLTAGDFCILAPNVEHGIEVFDEDSIVLNILVRYSTYLDIFADTSRDRTRISQFFLDNIYAKRKPQYMLFRAGGDEVIRGYLLDMYLEQLCADDYSDRMMCSLLTILFTQLVRRHEPTLEPPHPDDGRGAIVDYIASHYADVTIDRVAAEFHFSRQYCSRLIKELTGLTYTELLTGMRLQQSENLLNFTDLSVAEISARVGYRNPETFIRLFKRRRGCTPGQFRRMAGA